jgi:hypothetical protein
MEASMVHRILAASDWLASLASAAIVFAGSAPAADNIRYVSTTGSNTNNCKLAAPCRTLQRGINRTPAGGELRVLDSGDYGPSGNINKSLTIAGNGHTIFVENGIVIDNADAIVTLRHLVLDGQGQNVNGVLINAAETVRIERSTIHSFAVSGIRVTAADAPVFVRDSIVRYNGDRGLLCSTCRVAVDNARFDSNSIGIQVFGGRAAIHGSTVSGNENGIVVFNESFVSLRSTVVDLNTNNGINASGNLTAVTVESSLVHGNGIGLFSNNGRMRISNSTITGNVTGISNGGIVETRGNNTVRDNTTDLSGNALTPLGGV